MKINFDINIINQVIDETNIYALMQHYVNLDGFIFSSIHQANVFNAIVLRNPSNAKAFSPIYGHGERSLDECIELINEYSLEHAIVIGTDISFITQCPSLKHLEIYPSSECADGFDYSPLYDMPEILSVHCRTVYDRDERYSTIVDYSKIKGLKNLRLVGKGNLNYQSVQTLKELQISQLKEKEFLRFDLPVLLKLSAVQCDFCSLSGVENCPQLQWLSLSYMRSLTDISALKSLAPTLRALYIENCPKISDFSVIAKLKNLEYLELTGKNEIPSLDFIRELPNLKFISLSMNVLDGDITPCLGMQYADVVCKRHYNLKNKDLPKDRTDLGFGFI